MLNSGLNTGRAPNFPTPPTKKFVTRNMPNDLIADGRNYYTEIKFVDYRSAIYGEAGAKVLQDVTNFVGDITFGLTDITNDIGNLLMPGGFSTESISAIRLPIPANINDTMTFNWSENSAMDQLSKFVPDSPVSRAVSLAAGGLGAFAGKTLNPLLYVAFNRPNFRSFKFQWSLVPRNKYESETIRLITQTFKHSASPSGGLFMDYPYVAIVHMFPNNLNGHAIFKPMVVRGIDVNLTPLPTPSFFENGGAPTMVNLSVDMMEIKLWHREDIKI